MGKTILNDSTLVNFKKRNGNKHLITHLNLKQGQMFSRTPFWLILAHD